MSDASYRNLKVWQKAVDAAARTYEITRDFPKEEQYGLTSQMRRSAISVAANIAEGYGRDGDKSFVQFLRIAQGSLKELETLVVIAERVSVMQHGSAADLLSLCSENGKMLRALIASIHERQDS